MLNQTRIKTKSVLIMFSAIGLLVSGCEKSQTGRTKNLGSIKEKSLNVTQAKLDNLTSCTFDNHCRNNEVCSVLDLPTGRQNKCTDPINICKEASCSIGSCIAIGVPITSDGKSTTVTCVDGGDYTNGIPGSAPGNSGSGSGTGSIGEPTHELVVSDLRNLASGATSFSVEAKLPSTGELIRIVVNQPVGSQCQVEAARATDGKTKLALWGEWKAIKVSGFSGTTYQFSKVEYCYSGDIYTNQPAI